MPVKQKVQLPRLVALLEEEMKGRLREEPGTVEVEIIEQIPWPRGGLPESPVPYQLGQIGRDGSRLPVLPGERALIDRMAGYLVELVASCGCRSEQTVAISLRSARPKHAEVRLVLPLPERPAADQRERLERRLSGLCCGPAVAYTDGRRTWYQCGNCARLFCPRCWAADLASEQDDDGEWILACEACNLALT